MLTVTNISKQFGERDAVREVSFSVKSGEVYALIGPNGSGKSTLVRLIAGLLAADAGTILVEGQDVALHPQEAKAVAGYIPDEPSVWAGMTGEELLHFTGALYGMTPADRTARIAELLPVFGLETLRHEPFEGYSRGSKQKFSILAALLHRPKLLLIDEPIVGLDPESAEIAKELFRDFAREGGSVLLVTHTLPVAEEIADRIGLLRTGALVAQGSMRELRAELPLAHDASLEEIYRAHTK